MLKDIAIGQIVYFQNGQSAEIIHIRESSTYEKYYKLYFNESLYDANARGWEQLRDSSHWAFMTDTGRFLGLEEQSDYPWHIVEVRGTIYRPKSNRFKQWCKSC